MPLLGKRLQIVKISGISIDVDPSWIVIFLFLTWGLSTGYLPAEVPGQTPFMYWVFAVMASLGLFVSVTVHELGHSLVARARGMEVNRIVLFIFGGVSQLEEEPEKPGTEFIMAIVGPIVSLSLAAVFWSIHSTLWPYGEKTLPGALIAYMAVINLVLGVFNLLPGFPLDGGRVLRSILWFRWNDQVRATRVASQSGSGLGLFLMIMGGFNILGGNAAGGFWYILIGFFLRNAALSSFRQLSLKQVLERVKVKDLMTENPVSVSPDLSLGNLVEDYILKHHHPAYPVTENGILLGLIHMDRVKSVPRDQWATRTVRDVMTPSGDLSRALPNDSASDLLKLFTGLEGRILVTREGRLEGILSRRDLFDYITLKTDVGNVET
jgi:Zn-dependent protease/predicted transcriptional regulator